MASTVHVPANFGEYSYPGHNYQPWSNLANCYADDSAYATVNIYHPPGSDNIQSRHTLLWNFHFSIPPDATIDGVEIRIKAKTSGGDNRVSVAALNFGPGVDVDPPTQPPAAKGGVTSYVQTTEGTQVFGSPTDKWGATLTPSFFNDSTMGVSFIVWLVMGDVSETVSLNYVEMTVYYTPAGYPHKVFGCLPATIAKIMGIPIANIAKFNGV